MTVFAGAPRVTPAVDEDAPDYASMTKAELTTLAKERGIDVPKSATKAQLVELLRG